ncbi:glycerophosphodiester phosphodiesterase [Caldalkalibacillus uzonensis]|uniref:glycerophosphodiester phosphodiesterase n=1 Tax=Caldalkalibacillus uzonensis TaxID=353224 RepID=UPI0027D8BEEF|nr:glycerophosphodiester phosphodiesterase family protein [Caldalkalibacillus uzonensis]
MAHPVMLLRTAFQLAIEQGCDAIELDVHLSADHELIVCHDPSINRTTNGKGLIKDLTAKELKQYDAGYWFSDELYGQKIPLLEEVIDIVPLDVNLIIEIKNIPHRYETIEQKLIDVLINTNRITSSIIISFDHHCLQNIKTMAPDLKIGLLYKVNLINHYRYTQLFNQQIYSLHPHYRTISESQIHESITHGLKVFTWTVNRIEDMKQQIDNKVSGIITDFPDKLGKLLVSLRNEANNN